MGLFSRRNEEPAARQPPAGAEQFAGAQPAGSSSWARQVLALLAPPQPGFVKRCGCVVCGAPKKLPSVTAYVYCDYCAALIDFDLRTAGEADAPPGPAYAATVSAAHAASQAAIAAGDHDTYRDLQRRVFEAYVTHVPMAVSHRARNDAEYRRKYIAYMAEAAVARAFDTGARALDAEMQQCVLGLRYAGNMMAPVLEPGSFWPLADTLQRQISVSRSLYRSAGLAELDPDRAEHLIGKIAWSGFCQGWLPMLPPEAAHQLLERAGLVNEYVQVQAEGGQPRHCGGCGGEFLALPGARAVVCDSCGRVVDAGAAEIACTTCGGSITFPAGAERVGCPYCQAEIRRAGIR